jgi:hypothetical protein
VERRIEEPASVFAFPLSLCPLSLCPCQSFRQKTLAHFADYFAKPVIMYLVEKKKGQPLCGCPFLRPFFVKSKPVEFFSPNSLILEQKTSLHSKQTT